MEMMMSELTEQEILDNAPDGATHISVDNAYVKYCGGGFYQYKFEKSDEWKDVDVMLTTRKLSDIQALVDKDKRIADLEKELQWVIDTCNHPTKGISIYDLDRIEEVLKNE